MEKVKISALMNKVKLRNLTEDIDLDEKYVTVPDVNRPSFQLFGFFEHFDVQRIQVIGNAEHAFLQKMTKEERL